MDVTPPPGAGRDRMIDLLNDGREVPASAIRRSRSALGDFLCAAGLGEWLGRLADAAANPAKAEAYRGLREYLRLLTPPEGVPEEVAGEVPDE